jgi:transcriptional regulator with XRE-family HTH domain
MNTPDEDIIRLILGLKIKHIRLEKGISQSELSSKTGISVSYLNEIEKGKKNPKPSKIAALADALGASYDEVVSLKLSNKLAPVGELLRTNLLRELPLEHFGLDPSRLLDIFVTAPNRFSAFISTLIDLSRTYDLRLEEFYFMALRSYQEIHNNYFEELEVLSDRFRHDFELPEDSLPSPESLIQILQEEYGLTIKEVNLEHHPRLSGLRTLFTERPMPSLYINRRLNGHQKAFSLARELGYLYMSVRERPFTSSWVQVNSFEEVLNNFKASYFAGALLLNRDRMVQKLKDFFANDYWDGEAFLELMQSHTVSPEMFLQRLTSLLPRFFNINRLFFTRINYNPQHADSYRLTKELNLSDPQNHHAVRLPEHYCRRWTAITTLQRLARRQHEDSSDGKPLLDIQRATYTNTQQQYLVFSIARPMYPTPGDLASVNLGLLVNDNLRQKVNFLNDGRIPFREVNRTCERCPIEQCQERAASSSVLKSSQQRKAMQEDLEKLRDQLIESAKKHPHS